MGTLFQDIRYGFRMLAKSPGLTLGAIVVLGFGIAANVINFSMANAYLLRQPHFAEPKRLVHVWETNRRQGFDQVRASLPNFLDWKAQNRVFTDMAVFNYTGENLIGAEGPERIQAGRVSANVFDVLGVKPVLGRDFAPGEDQPGKGNVAVLSYRMWQQRFGGRRDALGQMLNINDRVYTIIGVMPEDFAFPLTITQIWLPREFDLTKAPRDQRFLQVAARLKPGVTMDQARAEMNALAQNLAKEYPQANADSGVSVRPLRRDLNFAFDVLSVVLGVLGVAGFFLLLVSCANVANLMMSRALGRLREMAIRAALGASRIRVIRQLLTESVLLALGGGALGALLAQGTLRSVGRLIPEDLYKVGELQIDPASLAFTGGLCLMTAVIFGLAPAVQISRPNLSEALKEGSLGAATGRRRQRLYGVLTVAQVSLSLVLLVVGTLIAEGFVLAQKAELGFDTHPVLTMQISLPGPRYSTPEQRAAFHRQVLQEAKAVPGVISAATVNYLPLNHETDPTEVQLEAVAAPKNARERTASTLWVTPEFFQTAGITLRKGRAFTDPDDANAPTAVIINEALEKKYFPQQDALGRTVYLKSFGESKVEPATIVGVARDIVYSNEFEGILPLQIYRPQYQDAWSYFRLVTRATGDPAALVPGLREAVWRVDPRLPIVEVRTMADVVAEWLLPVRMMAVALAVFAVGALTLAAVGLYGIVANWVAQRTREIGIRMALGAQRNDVLRLVLRQGILLVGIGGGVGLAASLGLSKVLTSVLGGLQWLDPLAFIGGPLLLLGVALLACYVPARRAARASPMEALRYE